MLKILSWNIRQGGGSRNKGIISAIEKVDPQILALNEWRNNHSGLIIRSNLLRMGYIHQSTTGAGGNYNSVFLASKYPFLSSLFTNADPNFPHNIVCGRFEAFEVYSVYLPHKKKHQLFGCLHEQITKRDVPSIIVGDLNTGHNYIDQKGNSFWYTDELVQLESLGMKDAFRYIHGEKKEYSWYSHQKNGYRYDHTYTDESLFPWIQDCHYLHEYREEGLSDHSPMLLLLNV